MNQWTKSNHNPQRIMSPPPTTMRTVCNYCEQDHYDQVNAAVTGQRYTSVTCKVDKKKKNSGALRLSSSSSLIAGGRKRSKSADFLTNSGSWDSREAGEVRYPEKCIICRSNCSEIAECQQGATAIYDQCAAARVTATKSSASAAAADEASHQPHEQQQKPVNCVSEEEASGTCFGEMSLNRARRGCCRDSTSFFFDWGGALRSGQVCCCAPAPAREEDQKCRRSERGSKGMRFSGSMLLALIIGMFLSTTTTISPWNVGGLLMGPGAVMVGASEISAGWNLTAAQETGVCQSMDVRNKPDQLEKLKNCRVIEGFLQILLMDNPEGESFENYTFPLLTEITDFLLVYRVTGLKSLGRLFPNLAVIRGNKLFLNYALVVFEVFTLEEVGLHSLKFIGRGAVRIEKNQALCFSQSIDWSQLMNETHHEGNDFILNRKENECPVCPGGNSSDLRNCPHVLTYPKKTYACWNLNHCQVVCPPQCPYNCDGMGKCCDKSCLGGCSLGNPRNCTSCRHYSLGNRPDRRCIDDCPEPYIKHMGRRCITKTECLSIRKPIQSPFDMVPKPYIPFARECRLECPESYQMDRENRTCQPCPETQCKKICVGAKIDSISAAQRMADCQIITGTLEIQIRREGGLSVVNELERFLSKIEKIEGHLKISRSDPLVSLSFLKNLKEISGMNSDGRPKNGNEPSFTLTENENLQNLFSENQTVRILNGMLNFHTNPKLCVNRIETLRPMLDNKTVKFDLESFRSSNGDRVACDQLVLEPKVDKLVSRAATVQFEPLENLDDERSLLGYVIHYKPAPEENVTLFDGRDACGFDGWQNDDIGVSKDPIFVLTHLEPYTKYAYYVKTVQLASAQKGGESTIKYFTTLPDEPMIVRNVRVKNSEDDSLTLVWDAPWKSHGNLTTYIITATISVDNEEMLKQRNYCAQKWEQNINNPSLPATPPPEKFPDKTPTDEAACDCQKEQKLQTSSEAENMIQFEDAIHNYVYIKRQIDDEGQEMRRRRRRSTDNLVNLRGTDNSTDDDVFPSNLNKTVSTFAPRESIKDRKGRFEYFYGEVAVPTTTLKIAPLKHFTVYSITIIACRSGSGTNCSTPVIVTHRTEPKAGADDIGEVTILANPKNNSHNLLALTWAPPPEPNGPLLSYTIKYTNKDIENGIGQLTCIRAIDFEAQNREYKLKLGAENGNYSVEVQVTALGGPGVYSDPIYYRIENPNYTWWIVLGVLSIILILLGALIYYFYQNKKREKDHRLFAEVNPDYDATPYIPDEYEIPRERVKRSQELGQGSFGMVYAGSVQLKEDDPEETQCAIKTVNDSATERERMNFLKEAHVMKEFHTPHVVQLLGVVSKGDPPLVVMELMAVGDLKGYLRAHRPDADVGLDGEAPVPPSVRQILQMAIEIADGMAYLSYKKFVHRDLAARNCMVAGDMTVKIGDFGMTRDIYETDYYRKGDKGLLPVRWMSPESLKDGIFTTSNDVFSYGVVLWEMATLASQPYQGLSNDQVLRYVIDGGVMERPENCPEKIYQLMRRCWSHRPSSRPTFLDIVAMLLEDVNADFYRNSFYFSEEGEAHRYMLQNEGHHPDEGTTLLRPENEMSHENARENWDMPNNNNNSRRLLEEGGAMPIIKPAQSPLRFLTGKSGNDYKESKF